MTASRRLFLKRTGAVALGFSGLHAFVSGTGCAPEQTPADATAPVGYGPLVPDPHRILDLPEGFSYRVISRAGDVMSDGFFVPASADGMAAFEGPDGRTILVCNHEISVGTDPERGAFGPDNQLLERLVGRPYDAGKGQGPCLGGTTTLVYNTATQELESQYLSLVGTVRNCAGGPTPWGTWITCEETTQRADDVCAHDHGYNFEVPASATPGLVEPIPLKAMGRFNHEAVAVDPATGIVYQTEDRGDGLIYRFIPNTPERLAEGGRLQALVVTDAPSLDTRNWEEALVEVGQSLAVHWIDLDNVDAPEDDLRMRGFEQGAARFARGEGMWYGNDGIYFACTNGGAIRKGQIWKYVPGPNDGDPAAQTGELTLFVEPNDATVVENADNLTVAPWGHLIVCEDGPEEQFLVGITQDGALYKLGRNAINSTEFAGATFSPDGTTLFVNIMGDGPTLAITGPWTT